MTIEEMGKRQIQLRIEITALAKKIETLNADREARLATLREINAKLDEAIRAEASVL